MDEPSDHGLAVSTRGHPTDLDVFTNVGPVPSFAKIPRSLSGPIGFRQGLLAVHHARTVFVAELLDGLRRDGFSHEKIRGASCSCCFWWAEGARKAEAVVAERRKRGRDSFIAVFFLTIFF